MINVFQPALGAEELAAVAAVFQANWPGRGALSGRFEADFAQHLGTDPSLLRSLTSCTEGLFASMRLLDVGDGDEVILPSISFVGAANAILAVGARPVFCDVDAASLNCTPAAVERCVSAKTKAVLILHYGGNPCDMDGLREVVNGKGLRLIEDNACSVASRYRGQACGLFGDASVWSFDAAKVLTTGDGGMIWRPSPEQAQAAEDLLSLGQDRKSGISSEAATRWWEFDVTCCGRKGLMNDVAAAIGVEQLRKLPAFVARRKEIHETYDRELEDLEWLTGPPEIPPYAESSYYQYWVQCRGDRRDRLATHLRARGIYTTFRYFPLHRVAFYGWSGPLPAADKAADETLCLPLHPSLSTADLDQIINAVREFRP